MMSDNRQNCANTNGSQVLSLMKSSEVVGGGTTS
jgi:hypothetical protein